MNKSKKVLIIVIPVVLIAVIGAFTQVCVCNMGCGSFCAGAFHDTANFTKYAVVSPFDFESKAIDNGFHNYMAGGMLAYKDNTLYIENQFGSGNNLGLYAVNKDSAEKIHGGSMSESNEKKPIALPPFGMYLYGGKIYVAGKDASAKDKTVKIFDESARELTDSKLGIEADGEKMYISDNLLVWADCENYGKLNVKYNGKQTVVDDEIHSFDIADGKILYINSFGNLYSYSPETSKKELVAKKDRTDISYSPEKMICSNGYCYLSSGDLLACYSFDSGEFEYTKLLKEKVNCFNSYNGKTYAAADSGVYSLEKGESKKISNIKSAQVYIFDEDYIFIRDNYGKVIRLNPETGAEDTIIG